MRDDPSVVALVARAADGDQGAWNELVERYAPLIWSVCLRYKLGRQDIDDVGQSVWLLLVENIGNLRDPAALPGWLATTAQRECFRVMRAAHRHDHRELPSGDQMSSSPGAATIEEEILAAERDAALRAAFAELRRPCRELLSMLMCDPPCSYADISATLDMAVGSIGSMRARCLSELRRSRHVAAIAENRPQRRGTGKVNRDD
ncbi:MAG TPA: sigma-70 family RNA polymerase sigma factor [Streptosporangiaceae bacterium]|nr:sigma-70 family RNA polymerase sigma factor [Streptosporangiaceae bacterium]